MPYVDESLLEHNLREESGIQRLWEDEQIELKMRDMRISEGCVMVHQKDRELEREYREVEEAMEVRGIKASIKEEQVIAQALQMLQGIPGQIFQLEEKAFTFTIQKDFRVIGYAMDREAI